MGNEHSAPRNLDKQKARAQNKERFAREIETYRARHAAVCASGVVGRPVSAPPVVLPAPGQQRQSRRPPASASGGIRVVCRKRPLFDSEMQPEYDAVTAGSAEGLVVAHDGRMRPNMRDITVSHVEYQFDQVFDENDDTRAVYERAEVHSLLDAVVSGDSNAYLMMFGQTGSGKTHTMQGIQACVAQELFAKMEQGRLSPVEPGEKQQEPEVRISAFEICGERCVDLLPSVAAAPGASEENGGAGAGPGQVCPAPLKLQEKDGEVFVSHLREHGVRSSAELLSAVQRANVRRATAATGVHSASSRSHALYGVKVLLPRTTAAQQTLPAEDGAAAADQASQMISRTFWLVDLAGSEWSKDSAEHDALRRVEGSQINKSLLALKECIRLRRQKTQVEAQHVPYRQSALTKVLKGCFVDTSARTLVVCTVSPCGSDTEHTQCTLSHGAAMLGQKDRTRAARASTSGSLSSTSGSLGSTSGSLGSSDNDSSPAAGGGAAAVPSPLRRGPSNVAACMRTQVAAATAGTLPSSLPRREQPPTTPLTSTERTRVTTPGRTPSSLRRDHLSATTLTPPKTPVPRRPATPTGGATMSGFTMPPTKGGSQSSSEEGREKDVAVVVDVDDDASVDERVTFQRFVPVSREPAACGRLRLPVGEVVPRAALSRPILVQPRSCTPRNYAFSPRKRTASGGAGIVAGPPKAKARVEPAFFSQHPSRWSTEEVAKWWECAWWRGGASHLGKATPTAPRTDGKGLVRFSKQRLVQLCNDEQVSGERMYMLLKGHMQAADALKRQQVLERRGRGA